MPHDARVRHTAARSAKDNVPPDARGGVGGGAAAEKSHLVVPEPDYASDSEEDEGEEEEEEEEEGEEKHSRHLPSMTHHGKVPGRRRVKAHRGEPLS